MQRPHAFGPSDSRCLRLRLEGADGALFLAFTSNNVYPGPVFEFARSLDALGLRQVLVRDPYRLWYHRGVPGVGNDIGEVRECLAQIVAAVRPRRTVTLGTSAGGYAAILFGLLLDADEVLAFAPQTRLTWRADSRTPRRIEKLHALAPPGAASLDLRAMVEARAAPPPRIRIYHSADDALDVRHARHLEGLANVELHPLRLDGHRIIPQLKRDGTLQRLLLEAARGA